MANLEIIIDGYVFVSTGKTVTSPGLHNVTTRDIKREMEQGFQFAFVPLVDYNGQVIYEIFKSQQQSFSKISIS